ncbi:spermatogenesis-associated protein 22 isoform X2 [Hypanus sabinus]|uniref:spermatogenesis-associated protein 22 isoform X2 n=1 Tax=Hypanus sabinus TaxID=79690 RepID=UPI0028C39BDC|nr:spermatogenesis-associated protein 22 isoform X2 [Hypanus sabinus]
MSGNLCSSTDEGCFPVLLFNQRKRTRLPLTSNPMEHESSSNSNFPTSENFDSPPAGNRGLIQSRPQSNQITMQNSYEAQLQYPSKRSYLDNTSSSVKTMKTSQPQQHVPQHERAQAYRKFSYGSNAVGQSSWNQVQQQIPHQQQRQEHKQFSSGSNTTGQSNKTSWNTGVKHQLGNTWKENPKSTINDLKEFASTTGTNYSQMKMADSFRSHVSSDPYKAQTKSYQQIHQKFKNSPQNIARNRYCSQQNEFTENHFINNPDDGVDQRSKPTQMKLTQPDNTLRVMTATIEGMKHWTQYSDRLTLLFEVFATLDSAVITGEYGAKNFLLRDRKNSVPCVFYETDRDLPRLIRGQIHRCMGTYDKKRNLFKCVSVRPTTAVEQKTFTEFVSVADAEMTQFVKALNEV